MTIYIHCTTMDAYPSPFDLTNDVANDKNRYNNCLHNDDAIDSKTTTSQVHNITTTTTTTTLDTSSSEGEENDLNFVVPRQSLYPQLSLLSSSVLSSTYRVPRQRRRCSHRINYTKGLWSEFEQRQFLTGLMIYGWGQWKEIGIIIPTRYVVHSSIQNQPPPSFIKNTHPTLFLCRRFLSFSHVPLHVGLVCT